MISTIIKTLKAIRFRLIWPSLRTFRGAENCNNAKQDKIIISQDRLLGNQDSIKKHLIYNETMEFIILHKFMEERLRKRVSEGKKVRVLFISQYLAKFDSCSIYYAMEQDELFEPYILVTHSRDKRFEEEPSYLEEAKRHFKIMKDRGYRVVFGYDDNLRPIQLETIKPDIIIYDNPNMSNTSHYQNEYLNANYLTCYVPYYFNVANLKDRVRNRYTCENYKIMTAWKVFVECYETYYAMTENVAGYGLNLSPLHPGAWNNLNAVLSGYPKLDAYVKPYSANIPPKIDNGKPLIIYAPHHSIHTGINLATFHLYHKYFFDMVLQHPEFNFVYKPHPDLRNRIIDIYNANRHDTITPDEYDQYVKKWDSMPNGIYIDDGEYIELFKRSTCLITDSFSFIAEYLPSKHPCIYILNPEKKDPLDFYDDFARKVLDTYYCCSEWNEIEKLFEEVVINGNDYKKQQRENVEKVSFVNLGNAGQYISDYIKNQLVE